MGGLYQYRKENTHLYENEPKFAATNFGIVG